MKTKAIIDGKRYDTTTATKLATYGNGLDISDFRNVTEILYRTPCGAFFISATGGPYSKYAIVEGNRRSGDSRIVVLSNKEAQAWLEEHQYVKTLEKYFGDSLIDG